MIASISLCAEDEIKYLDTRCQTRRRKTCDVERNNYYLFINKKIEVVCSLIDCPGLKVAANPVMVVTCNTGENMWLQTDKSAASVVIE